MAKVDLGPISNIYSMSGRSVTVYTDTSVTQSNNDCDKFNF